MTSPSGPTGRRSDANRLPWPLAMGLAAVPVTALAVFYLWPFTTLVVEAVDAAAVGDAFSRVGTWDTIWFTTWQAIASTVITIVAGLPATWAIARHDFVGRRTLAGLLAAMFVLPTVVMGAAVSALLPDSVSRSVTAVLLAHVVFNLAVVVRTVGPVWARLPDDLEHAAQTLGASPFAAWRSVTLPLLGPAIAGAASIVFLFTFTSFGVVRIIGAPGTRTIEVEVWRRATQLGAIGEAAVLALFQLAALAVALIAMVRLQRRLTVALPIATHVRRRRASTARQRLVLGTVVGVTGLLVVAPLAALVIGSFSTPRGWTTEAWRTLGSAEIRPGISLGLDPLGAIERSLSTAAWATAFAVVIGGLAGLAVQATRRAGRLLDVGLALPLATSAVTIGFGMLITFDVDPVDWRASWWLVPVGHALIAVPFVVRTTTNVLRALSPELTAAAATLGASPIRAWREIVVAHLWRPLAVAAALAAAISLGEFGATSFLSRSGGETLPIAVEQLLGRAGALLQAKGNALAAVLAFLTIAVVLVVDRLDRTGAGARRRVAGDLLLGDTVEPRPETER
ncbi:MAG: ABC transporter permease subunit [Actinomycetota bacterium]